MIHLRELKHTIYTGRVFHLSVNVVPPTNSISITLKWMSFTDIYPCVSAVMDE